MMTNVEEKIIRNFSLQLLVYLPQMWSMKTEAMKRRDMTKTGTGPTFKPGESSV